MSLLTEKALAASLKKLLEKKTLDKITVKDITDDCGVNRQTFYYHFQDIMEVIGWSLEQAAKNMLAKSLEADTPEEALGILISSAVENRTLIRRLLDSQKREQIEKLFVHAARTYLQELIRNKPHKVALDYADTEIALDFWAFGIIGLLFKYTAQDRIDVENLANQICRLLPEKGE